MKRYILFAGVNGAGKTTLYHTSEKYKTLPRINVDEIVKEYGSWENYNDVARAGRTAVSLIRRYLSEGISFNQETTLCGRTILRNIRVAKERGYRVEIYFVGLDSVELAKLRVQDRVRNGGHGIPEEDIERRYFESIEHLKIVMPMCDHVELYDNTQSFRQVAVFEHGVCVDKDGQIPDWCRELIDNSGDNDLTN